MINLQSHEWITQNKKYPLLTNLEISKPITVTEDECKNSIKSLYKLDTLVCEVYVNIWQISLN